MPNTKTVHTLTPFENALQSTRNEILRMASKAEQNFKNAVNGLLQRNIELCNEAIADDDEVDNLERSIDAQSFEILMRYNPVASDLRSVFAGMKVANNLERISDEAQTIARRSRKMIRSPEVIEVRMVEPLFNMALGLLRDSVRSFSDGDMELALSLYERDKELDDAHKKVIKDLSKMMEGENDVVKPFLHMVFIIRSIERVGDHAVNIAEDGIFVESAADVRHLTPEEAAEEVENS